MIIRMLLFVEVTNFSGILLSATFFVLVYEYVVAIIIAENSILSFIHAVNGLPFQIHAAHIGIITVSAMRVMDEHLVLQVDELRRQYLYLCTSKASKLRTWAKPASKGASGATANVCFFLVFCEVNLKTEVHGPVTLGAVCSSISLAQYCSPDPSPPTLHRFTRRSLRDTGAEESSSGVSICTFVLGKQVN
jgi:hypothetical protein